ncbi:hypothetical protein [Actinomadura sp. 9N215]
MREQLGGLKTPMAIKRAAGFRPGDITQPSQGARWVLARLARRIE